MYLSDSVKLTQVKLKIQSESTFKPSNCEATLLTTKPPCCLAKSSIVLLSILLNATWSLTCFSLVTAEKINVNTNQKYGGEDLCLKKC